MATIVRRTSTKVIDGRVSPKNRADITQPNGYRIVKTLPGRGYTHVVSQRQLEKFIELIPNWGRLSERLETIEISHGHQDYYGFHAMYRRRKTAIIALCAWPKALWTPLWLPFFHQHRHILDAIGVPYHIRLTEARCLFTVAQARAFTLLHVFMHEVGHNWDALHRRGPCLPNVEPFAEDFANSHFQLLLPLYRERFGDPALSRNIDDSVTYAFPA